jgi:outer membrane autotransporter protein
LLIFVGLLAMLAPDWGIGLRAQGLPVTLSPSSLFFGQVVVGTSRGPQVVTLTNNFTSESVGVSVIGPGGDYSIANGCPTTLPASSSCSISVTFNPSVTGPQPGTLAVDVSLISGVIPFSVTLNGEGIPPLLAASDAAVTQVGQPVSIPVLANDSGGAGIFIASVGAPSNGTAAQSGNSVVYTPNPGFFGTDSFTYTIADEFERFATGTVSVTVNPPGIIATNDAATTSAGTPVTVPVLANDTGANIALVGVGPPSNGTASISGNAVIYAPNPSFAGADSFGYTIRDSFGQIANATVTVTVTPPGGPVAVNDAATTPAGTPVAISVLANDSGTGIAIASLGTPSNGTVAQSGNAVIYTPAPGFVGTDSFGYTIRDSFGQIANATVTVTVTPPGGPVAVNDTATTSAGTPVTIDVLANDLGTGIAVSGVGVPSNGTVELGADAVVYTSKAGFAGTDNFSYTIRDSFGRTATATVTVTVTPPGLNAVDDTATTPARTSVTIPVLANDAGMGIAIAGVGTPSNGTASISGNAVVYTPNSNFAGIDSFGYTIRDNFGQTDTATVRVRVTAPTLDAVDDAASARTRTPVVIPVLANDIGTGLIITQVGVPSNGSATAGGNGTITYTSAANFTGTDAFTYTIADGIGTDTAVVTVTVTRSKEDVQRLLEDTTDNPNAKTIGRTIGGLCFERAASVNFLRDCDDLIDAADNGDSGVGLALEQITPADLGAALDGALTGSQTRMMGIRSRMASLRAGVMGIDLERLNIHRGGWTLNGRDLRYLLASVGGGGPGVEVDSHLGALGLFASGTFNFGDRDSTADQTGYDFKTRELTVGADYRFTDQFVLGAALSHTAIDADMDDAGGYLDTRGYGLTLYGTYYPTDRFYLDGMINYGWNDYDQRRSVRYRLQNTEVNQHFDSDYSGRQLFADLGAGYRFTRGDLSFGPELRLSYLDVRVDSFRERPGASGDGSAWAVAVEEQDLQSLVSSVGGRASYLIDRPWGTLQPQVEFGWLHEFNDDRRLVRGRFLEGAVVPDNLFQLVMDPVDKDYFRLGLGLSARFDRGPSALIQYRTLFDYRNLEDHAITTELRWEF